MDLIEELIHELTSLSVGLGGKRKNGGRVNTRVNPACFLHSVHEIFNQFKNLETISMEN